MSHLVGLKVSNALGVEPPPSQYLGFIGIAPTTYAYPPRRLTALLRVEMRGLQLTQRTNARESVANQIEVE
jgi:hypothetical protein